MKRSNLWGPTMSCSHADARGKDAHLWLQLIYAPNSFVNVPSFDGITYQHAFLDRLVVDANIDSCFLGKFHSRITVPFDDKVVENNSIQIPEENNDVSSTSMINDYNATATRRKGSESKSNYVVLQCFLGEIPTLQ